MMHETNPDVSNQELFLQKILSTFDLVLLDFLKSWTARVQLV